MQASVQWTVVGIYGQHGLPVASRVDPGNKHVIENVQIRNRYLEGSRVQENPLNPKIVIFDFVVLMALGPAGCGPRVQARVDQAGGLKDAPAQTPHP